MEKRKLGKKEKRYSDRSMWHKKTRLSHSCEVTDGRYENLLAPACWRFIMGKSRSDEHKERHTAHLLHRYSCTTLTPLYSHVFFSQWAHLPQKLREPGLLSLLLWQFVIGFWPHKMSQRALQPLYLFCLTSPKDCSSCYSSTVNVWYVPGTLTLYESV